MRTKSLLGALLAGAIGLMLSALLVPGFKVEGDFWQTLQILLLSGFLLGLINYFIKPIIHIVTLPLQILTFGILTIALNMGILWLVVLFFEPTLQINGFKPLFLTSVLVWLAFFFAPKTEKHYNYNKRKNV